MPFMNQSGGGVTVTGKKFNVTGTGSVLNGSDMLTIFPTAGTVSGGGAAGVKA